ncbi:MAG: cytochrome c3 family protein [Deltaproteobacteria bacterium]|nr:cytochrome c3 family protein [Deltaproteobacteria bacterium]
MAIKKQGSRVMGQGSRVFLPLLVLIGTIFITIYSANLFATDPPHRDDAPGTDTGWCGKCHTPHSSAGGALTKAEGIANLCITCHNTAGRASDKPFIDSDQSVLGPASGKKGSSHRWDSGLGGYVEGITVSPTTTGRIISGLVGGTTYTFVGTTPRIYQINISTTGNVGTAKFGWKWSLDGGVTWSATTSGVATLSVNSLNTGGGNRDVELKFIDGTPSPSFAGSGDVYRVYVRPEITYPKTAAMAVRMFKDPSAPNDSYGKAACSTCHSQHKQEKSTSDPTSNPSYTTAAGISNDRHFQRINNMTNSMCLDCHSIRNTTSVRTYTGGNLSHPVGVSLPASSTFHAVPYEAAGATTVQTQYSYKGSVTSGGGASAVSTFWDSTKTFNAATAGKIIRFTTGTSKNTTRTVSSVSGSQVSWSASTTIANSDKYEIDADGNLSNNIRLYNAAAGIPSFTAGQVMCLSCHNIHWADSNDTTADCDGCY